MARRIYTELVAKGKVTRGWLGVSIQPPTPELAKSFGLREAKGVLISDLVQDSPAETAGIAAGDIITDFDTKQVCMALAAHTRFEPGQRLSTSSLAVSFLAPVTAGPVLGEGSVIERERSVVFLEAVLHDREGRECAHASSMGSIRART
ncbi:MAG: PDZ domain-containing protein [Candidatus Rokubacteria bacterium]|nr:PDZ domain-containing protein [Candidatus Rokubacteria bacterium]